MSLSHLSSLISTGSWKVEDISDSVRVSECSSVRVFECSTVRLFECPTVRVFDLFDFPSLCASVTVTVTLSKV